MTSNLNLLLIDDDEVDRMTMIRSLKNAGINARIETAENGAEGLEKATSQIFDCIFLDFRLPDINGLELLQQFQERNITAPVLVITSYGDEQIAAEAIKKGAQDYISKSLLTPEGISHSLRNALRIHRTETEQKAIALNLQKTRLQLEAVINNSPIILWSLDANGIFTFFQGKSTDNLGFKPDELLGRSAFDVFADNQKLLTSIRKAFKGEVIKATNQINNIYLDTLYQLLQDQDGNVTGLTGVSFDVTERVNFEKELKKAKDLAEQSAKVKEQFLANISHEIRTPMHGIIGLTQLLAKTNQNAEQQSYLHAIQTSADRLMVIINDLLDISKIESGKTEIEETVFQVRPLLTDLVALMMPKASERNNRLKVVMDPGIPEVLTGDSGKLNQILTNLVGNAIKFTENGQIRILVDTLEENNEWVELSFEVQDSGIGIPEEKLLSIFDSFTQASSETTRKYGGTGLGLTISRQLVEMQGGTLNVKSKVNEGSTFIFNLKYRKPQPDSVPAIKEQITEVKSETSIDPADLGPLRILVAEDNEINQLLARKSLTDWGFSVTIAPNGKEAIDELQKNDFDLVLMDMQMPEMDGYEATVYIRNNMGTKSNIPVIAFTAHATKAEIARCLMAGANAYVSKPFKPEVLLQEIADQVEGNAEVRFKPIFDESENMPEPDQFEEIEPDLTFLKETSGGDPAFVNEIITTFIKQTPLNLEKMQQSLNQQDWTSLKAITHKLKSSMFLLGIKPLELLMLSIEQCATDPENQHQVQPQLNRVKQIVDMAIMKLQEQKTAV